MLQNITQGSRVGQILCSVVQNCNSSASEWLAEQASCECTDSRHASHVLSAIFTKLYPYHFLWGTSATSHTADEVMMAIMTAQVLHMVIFHIVYTRENQKVKAKYI